MTRAEARNATLATFASLYFAGHVLRAFLVNGWPFN